jgi:hypothetical protein
VCWNNGELEYRIRFTHRVSLFHLSITTDFIREVSLFPKSQQLNLELLVSVRIDAFGTFQRINGAEDLLIFFGFLIELDPLFHLCRKVAVWINGFNGTFIDAGIAINAGIWINIETVWSFMESIHRTDTDTGGKFTINAGFSYNVRHDILDSYRLESEFG